MSWYLKINDKWIDVTPPDNRTQFEKKLDRIGYFFMWFAGAPRWMLERTRK